MVEQIIEEDMFIEKLNSFIDTEENNFKDSKDWLDEDLNVYLSKNSDILDYVNYNSLNVNQLIQILVSFYVERINLVKRFSENGRPSDCEELKIKQRTELEINLRNLDETALAA